MVKRSPCDRKDGGVHKVDRHECDYRYVGPLQPYLNNGELKSDTFFHHVEDPDFISLRVSGVEYPASNVVVSTGPNHANIHVKIFDRSRKVPKEIRHICALGEGDITKVLFRLDDEDHEVNFRVKIYKKRLQKTCNIKFTPNGYRHFKRRFTHLLPQKKDGDVFTLSDLPRAT